MKRSLKKYEKYFKFHHYIAVLRRQPVHMQHFYAAFFAGSITIILAIIILYFDYGFWHEKYLREDAKATLEIEKIGEPVITVQSPQEMIGTFFKEAGDKIKTINIRSSNILDGTDSYTREE